VETRQEESLRSFLVHDIAKSADIDCGGDQDSLPSTTSTIRFAQSEDVHHIPPVEEMPPDVIKAVWYGDEDYSSFRKQCELTANKMEEGKTMKDKNHSALGLDAWTLQGHRRRERNRCDSVDVVLDEQFAQWDDGQDDHESIAQLYKARTEHPQMVANTKALVMEREVQEYMSQTLEDYDTLSVASYYSSRRDVSLSGMNHKNNNVPGTPKRRRSSVAGSVASRTSFSSLLSSLSSFSSAESAALQETKRRGPPPSPTPSARIPSSIPIKKRPSMKDLQGKPPPSPAPSTMSSSKAIKKKIKIAKDTKDKENAPVEASSASVVSSKSSKSKSSKKSKDSRKSKSSKKKEKSKKVSASPGGVSSCDSVVSATSKKSNGSNYRKIKFIKKVAAPPTPGGKPPACPSSVISSLSGSIPATPIKKKKSKIAKPLLEPTKSIAAAASSSSVPKKKRSSSSEKKKMKKSKSDKSLSKKKSSKSKLSPAA